MLARWVPAIRARQRFLAHRADLQQRNAAARTLQSAVRVWLRARAVQRGVAAVVRLQALWRGVAVRKGSTRKVRASALFIHLLC